MRSQWIITGSLLEVKLGSCFSQGHLVFNKLSDCLNFQIFFFKSGAVPNREETPHQKHYRIWGPRLDEKTEN